MAEKSPLRRRMIEDMTIRNLSPATQRGNMDRKIGGLDKYVGPNPSHQFVLADQLAWTFKQHREDFQSTTSKGHWLVPFHQKKLRREQAKRSE